MGIKVGLAGNLAYDGYIDASFHQSIWVCFMVILNLSYDEFGNSMYTWKWREWDCNRRDQFLRRQGNGGSAAHFRSANNHSIRKQM